MFKLQDTVQRETFKKIDEEYHKLRAEEELLELEMRRRGTETLKKNITKAQQKGQESNTIYGHALMQHFILPVAKKLDAFIADALSGRAGRRSRAAVRLEHLDSETVVYIALKNILENITMGASKAKVAEKIGHSIEDEDRFRTFHATMPQYYNKLIKSIGTSPTQGKYRHKRKVLVNRMNAKSVDFKSWEENEYMNVGITMLELFRSEDIGLICYAPQRAKNGKGNLDIVMPTAAALEKIEKKINKTSVVTPTLMPMICEPNDWVRFDSGGYVSPYIRKLKFVLARNKSFQDDLAGKFNEMQGVVDAANTVQKTPWRINKKVYDIVSKIYELNHAVGDLPYRDKLEVPPYPIHLEWIDEKRMTKDSRKKYKAWKESNPDECRRVTIQRAKIHKINSKLKSKRIQVTAILKMAEEYLERKNLWFVIQTDFRGRFYCASPFLNFQSADYARCMLEFANGKAIKTETAACWFLINGANLFGEDKVSLQERVNWAEQNKEKIIACADDPLSNTWWQEADKPFQFVAWCLEVKEFWQQGLGFISHLPVHLDGSCNAYQHMCALLKDEVGGKAVNLLPSETPEDVYGIIADHLKDKLTTDGSQLSNEWLDFGIDRKSTKKVTMTYNYGLTPYSARKYVEEHIEELSEKGKKTAWGEDLFEPSRFLSNILWASIGSNIKAAPKLMVWLQTVARLVARFNRPMLWTTPSGFFVRQEYPQMETARVKTKIGDSTIVVTKLKPSDKKLNRRKQSNGIVANYIHSLDAAALHISVNTAAAYGIKDFALIHDSYGVHAADVELMSQIIRKVFVEMYKREDLLEKFRDDIIKLRLIPQDKIHLIPPLPEKGNLDLDKILESDYFFA